MFWPFRRSVRPVSIASESDRSYVSRPALERAAADALAKGKNLVVYGPPQLGKTTLVTQQLAARDAIYVECRPGFKRTHIYRVILSSLGYALLVEKKKRGKASTTVKLGIEVIGASVAEEDEIEQVMQSVTVDLKNPSEVAHLISRLKRVPLLVLNNFQLLDTTTKKNLLFDIAFLTERPKVQVVIVGSWPNEDYLEELAPAIAGRFKYLFVPSWTEDELRGAAQQWLGEALERRTPPLIDEFLRFASGDVSLFRSLVDSAEELASQPQQSRPPATDSSLQKTVLARFERGLRTKLRAMLSERQAYLYYYSLVPTGRYLDNPDFTFSSGELPRTSINPETNAPYLNSRSVLVDHEGHPQYFERVENSIVDTPTDFVSFLFRQFHAAVRQQKNELPLVTLVNEFIAQLEEAPFKLVPARLKSVLEAFTEVQRRALVVPFMISPNSSGDAMEIVDRRLTLFLQRTELEDLDELLEDARPARRPKRIPRRNCISLPMNRKERAAGAPASQSNALMA